MKKLFSFVSLIIIFSPSMSIARAGDLDPTFGSGTGFVTTDFSGMDQDRTGSIAIQADGKIVVGGSTTTQPGGGIGTQHFALVRYNVDGTLDTTFGIDGRVITAFTPAETSTDMIASVVIQPDGKIIAGGQTDADFALARYNPNGSLDATFGTNGLVATSFAIGSTSVGSSIALQSDNRIVFVGQTNAQPGGGLGNTNFAAARYNTNGSIDTSFGTNGRVITEFVANSTDSGKKVIIQPDDKIIIAGQTDALPGGGMPNGIENFGLVRYNTNGSIDTSFGANGFVITILSAISAQLGGMALQPDGKIVTSGLTVIVEFEFVVVRYNKDGSLDTSFGSNNDGIVTTIFPAPAVDSNGVSVAIQKDDKLVVSGNVIDAGNNTMLAIARYTKNGLLDPTFGDDGLQQNTIIVTNFFGDMKLQADDRIVIASASLPEATSDFLVARFLNDTLTITKEASSKNPCPGQNITYTITATNFGAGGGTVNGIEIEDVLSSELIFRSAQTSGEASSFDAATGVWSIPCLRIGETATLKIKARVGQCAGNQVICNTAITSYSSVDNVTDSSLFEELGISTTEIFSTTECVSTLPVIYENINNIANRTDCGVDELNTQAYDLTNKVCDMENELSVVQKQNNTIIFKLNCLANFFSATDCLF